MEKEKNPIRKQTEKHTTPNFTLSVGRDTALGVGNLNTESLGLGNDLGALAGRDGVADLSSEGAVVHKEKLDVAGILDEERLVAGRHHVASFPVGTVSDRRHSSLSLEPSPNTVVNTLRLPPCRRHTFVGVALVAVELLCPLLNDRNVFLCDDHPELTVFVSFEKNCRWW